MIHVKFENIITKNGKGYKILSFSLLDREDLPNAYVYGSLNGTVAYATGGSIFVRHENNNGGGKFYWTGQILQEEEMKNLLRELKSAGKHLAEVKKPINELRKSGWEGKVWEVKI